jgi:type II restriction enzyme
MALDMVDYDVKVRTAVQAFWRNREAARQRQAKSGNVDQGERSGVTAGKNMENFTALIRDIVYANGLSQAEIHQERAVLSLPGFFRPTKLWDLIVMYKGELVAAIELKSQIGPSFGNNFNNRTEEAIGTAHDFWTAYREGAFGEQIRPFVGWLILVEDAPGSRSVVQYTSPHFPVFSEFKNASYLKRYDILCQKLVKEQLYTAASVIASPREAIDNGDYILISEMTDIKTFVSSFAGHIAATAARLG